MFVDQRWMDLAPGLVDRVRVIRDPGYERRLLEPQAPQPGGAARRARSRTASPVRFYHWSGFDPRKPTALSKHQDRYPDDRDRAAALHGPRVQRGAAGRGLSDQLRLALPPRLRSRTAIPSRREMRELFREQPAGRFPDPFEPAGEGSFVEWAVTPPPAGGPGAAAWSGSTTAGPAWTARRAGGGRCPCARCARSRVKLLEPLREALAPPRAAAAAGRPGPRAARPDVQQAFASPAAAWTAWSSCAGWRRTASCTTSSSPPGALRWLEHAEGSGVMRRLLDFYDAEPRAAGALPAGVRRGARRPRVPGLAGGPRRERGLPAPTLLGRAPALRRAARRRASARSTAAGPTCAPAYPDALGWPAQPGFLALAPSLRAAASTACPRTWVLWFERARRAARVPAGGCVVARARRAGKRATPGADRVRPRELPRSGCRARMVNRSCPHRSRQLCAPAAMAPIDELRLLHHADAQVRDLFPRAFDDVDDTEALVRHVEQVHLLPPGWLDRLRRDLPALCLREGATVVGYLRTESGMGELSRSTARALKAAGYPLTTVDVDDAPQRQFDLTLPHEDRGHPLPFTIVHMNAPEAVRRATRLRPWTEGRFPIGYWAWELAELPDDWTEAFAIYREVWTCSIHAATAIGERSPVPVQAMWPALPDALPSSLTREDFGLPDGALRLPLPLRLPERDRAQEPRRPPGGVPARLPRGRPGRTWSIKTVERRHAARRLEAPGRGRGRRCRSRSSTATSRARTCWRSSARATPTSRSTGRRASATRWPRRWRRRGRSSRRTIRATPTS